MSSPISPPKFFPAKPTRQELGTANKGNSSPGNSNQLETFSAAVPKQENTKFQPARPRPKLLNELNGLPDRRLYSEKNSGLVDDKTSFKDGSNDREPLASWKKDAATRRKDLLEQREILSNNGGSRPKLEKQKALQQLPTTQDIEERTTGPSPTLEESERLPAFSNQFSPRVTKALLNLIPKRTSEKSKKPSLPDEVDINARQVFKMSLKKVMKSLHESPMYQAASQRADHLGTMLPDVLETSLIGLLKDPDSWNTISGCKLTGSEAVAVRYYGREGFQYVQASLRQIVDPLLGVPLAPPGTFASLVQECKGAFAKLRPLPPDTILFRGSNFLIDENLKVGDVYEDPAFISTSTDINVANQKFCGRYLLKFINVPEDDQRLRDVSALTGNSKEAEVLGLPGMSYRVVTRGEGAGVGQGTAENPEIVTLEFV